MTAPAYVVVSPVKDEEKFVERTIWSVRKQTLPPLLWVIVDDGSSDATPEILDRHARCVEWIRTLRLPSRQQREPGSGVIQAFRAGYEEVLHLPHDFVVKLDCDLEFDHDYFERLIAQFVADPALGIASGVYLEKRNGEWAPIDMPRYHAAGASKMIRRRCFEHIQGFVPSRGWDTVDEIRAQVAGWRTAHFRDLKLLHLKLEGSGIGFLRTSLMSGEIYYLTGGELFFFLLKFVHRLLFGRPLLMGGVAMLAGYTVPWVRGRSRLVTEAERRFYRTLLNRRITALLMQFAEQASLRRRESESS